MLHLKTFRRWFVCLSFVAVFSCQAFITNVEYPNNEFTIKDKMKIGINLEGELFLLRENLGGELDWTQDYKPFNVLQFWNSLVRDKQSNEQRFVSFLLRSSWLQLQLADDPALGNFKMMTYIVQNLCFVGCMFAWREVFFANSKNDKPNFLELPIFMTQQSLHVQLACARAYCTIAKLITEASLEELTRDLPCKKLLGTWGFLFMLQRAAQCYEDYITRISVELPHFMASPYQKVLLSSVACDDVDYYNLGLLLRYANHISLQPAEKQHFQQVQQQIMSVSQSIPGSVKPGQQGYSFAYPYRSPTLASLLCRPEVLLWACKALFCFV